MEFMNKKIVSTILSAVLIVGTFQSCNSDIDATQGLEKGMNSTSLSFDLNSSERADIINSIEFEEYVKATAELASVYQKLFSTLKDPNLVKNSKKGVTPEGVNYITYPFIIDKNTINLVKLKTASLQKKYPTFGNLSTANMKKLMNEALLIGKINKIFREKRLIKKVKNNVRRKVLSNEGSGIMTFDSIEEAYATAMWYSFLNGVECAGFQLADGSAVLYLDPDATHSGTSYPGFQAACNSDDFGNVSVAIYDGQQITGTYHTHLDNYNWAPQDDYVQSTYFQDQPGTILYNGSAYTYNYSNGTNLGLSQ